MRTIKWVVYYGQTGDEAALAAYDIVVLDPGFIGSLAAIASKQTQVIGYVSLGEIRTAHPLFATLDPAVLLEENPAWPGTRRVDVRHPAWSAFVLDRVVPDIVAKGFTGLMFDTLDTPVYLEHSAPGRYPGMRKAAIALVRDIHQRYPTLMLIMNRGYDLIPDLAGSLDAVIAESLLAAPQPAATYGLVDPQTTAAQLAALHAVTKRTPPLTILSLDYWDPQDTATIALLYRQERALGHHPYVATRLLNQIMPEPTE